jgi:3-oxoacyl-[acyl-carrier protein] reductase
MNHNTAKLAGKVAVVTGGSSGIGAATVRLLANDGCTVAVGYNKGEERARRLLAELPGAGHGAFTLSLQDASTVRSLADQVRDRYGRVDILVNSAGYTQPIAHADLEALTDEFFDAMLIANVRGPFSLIRALNPLLQASGDGIIVNVSSISAFTGSGSSIAYCASKAALDTMTMSLARALGPKVRAMCVSPGAVSTGFVAGRDRAALEKIAQSTPLRRVIEPEDVADAIMACIVNLRTSTGSKLIVDGGRFLV